VSDPVVGRVLDGRYRVDELIARGGMATVYRGVDVRLDRPVAIKVMHGHYAEDADFVARFGREARAAARLNDPGVVAVYDQGEDAGCVFLVMEYVPGETLRDLLNRQGRLSAAEALETIDPVLAALASAHAAGIVHRDVKPENVLLADDGRVRVVDFGLARAFASAAGAGATTRTQGVILGTMAYLSPEQAKGQPGDARSDVYAVGVMLYELLTGTTPFTGDSPLSVAFQHVNEDVPPPSRALPGIHPAVDALVARATRRDPDERPADAGRLLQAVREVRRAIPADALGPAADPQRMPTIALATPVTRPTAAEPVVALPDTTASSGPATPRKGPGAVGGPPQLPTGARRRRRWWLVPLVLLLLLALASGAGYGTWWMTNGQWVRTPSVLALSQARATAKLTAAGLRVRTAAPQFSETVPAGQVKSTDPPPGARMHRHATVTLVLSKGPERYAVPDVTLLTVPAAQAALGKAHLALGEQTRAYSDTVAKGLIIRASLGPTDPPVARNTAVDVVVSRGPKPVPVPDLTGTNVTAATAQLAQLGLQASTTSAYSSTVPQGDVISQSPDHGTLAKGRTVALVVSKGPQLFAVPNVTGKSYEDAAQILTQAGFQVRRYNILGGFFDTVRRESPGAGSMQPKGTVITLTIV